MGFRAEKAKSCPLQVGLNQEISGPSSAARIRPFSYFFYHPFRIGWPCIQLMEWQSSGLASSVFMRFILFAHPSQYYLPAVDLICIQYA